MNNRGKGRKENTEVWEQGRLGKLLVLHKTRAGRRVQMRVKRLCTGCARGSVALSGVLYQDHLGGL